MEINGKHSITSARRSIIAAGGKQRVGKAVGQFEGFSKNQRKIIFVHGSIPVKTRRAVALMRTAIHGTPNVLSMIFWTPRSRVDRPDTTGAVGLGPIQQTTRMCARR